MAAGYLEIPTAKEGRCEFQPRVCDHDTARLTPTLFGASPPSGFRSRNSRILSGKPPCGRSSS
jgi:hypothetical protein